MSNDVFAEWKNRKFIVVGSWYYDIKFPNEHTVVLTDVEFWTTQYDELDKWCSQHGGVVSGMTVNFNDSKTLTRFCLEWA